MKNNHHHNPIHPKNHSPHRIFLLCALMLSLLVGCQGVEEAELQCATSADCHTGEMCRRERCILLSQETSTSSAYDTATPPDGSPGTLPPGPITQEPGSPKADTPDQGVSSQGDMGMDQPDARAWPDQSPYHGVGSTKEDMGTDASLMTSCEGVSPAVGELVINEILMNVPTGEEGDANADGVRDAYDDEFIELVNISSLILNLDGVELMVNDNTRHTFEPLCLKPGETLVIFSGPRTRVTTWRDDVAFMAPDSKLGLSNTQGKVELWGEYDRVIFSFEYEDAQKTSYLLWPELTGTHFVPHNTVSEELFSPGRCANGLSLGTHCGALTQEGE